MRLAHGVTDLSRTGWYRWCFGLYTLSFWLLNIKYSPFFKNCVLLFLNALILSIFAATSLSPGSPLCSVAY